MITRVPLAHQERMLRHLETQAAKLRAGTERLKQSVRDLASQPASPSHARADDAVRNRPAGA